MYRIIPDRASAAVSAWAGEGPRTVVSTDGIPRNETSFPSGGEYAMNVREKRCSRWRRFLSGARLGGALNAFHALGCVAHRLETTKSVDNVECVCLAWATLEYCACVRCKRPHVRHGLQEDRVLGREGRGGRNARRERASRTRCSRSTCQPRRVESAAIGTSRVPPGRYVQL